MWTRHVGLLSEEKISIVPAPVVAQAWRAGARQANLARLLAGCRVEEMTDERAHAVGELLGAAGTADIVDGAVVECAGRLGAEAILSSDPEDMRRLAQAAGWTGRVETV